jgi:hypothetical protein
MSKADDITEENYAINIIDSVEDTDKPNFKAIKSGSGAPDADIRDQGAL